MTVWDNVAFGLRYQKVGKQETKRRVGAALEMVRMNEFAKRRPAQMSGPAAASGAGRALVLEPRCCCSTNRSAPWTPNCDASSNSSFARCNARWEITFVYVTHDQEEALTMSDRIAVLAEGRIEQVGPPAEIYAAPATTYVAGFLGTANIFDADVLECGNGSAVCSALSTRLGAAVDSSCAPGPAAIVIRPERITLGPGRAGADGAKRHRGHRRAGRLPRRLDPGPCRRRAPPP